MRHHSPRLIRRAIAPLLALALTGCSIGQLVGAPTPEPFTAPTLAPVAPATAVAEPTAAAAPERRIVVVQRGAVADMLTLNGQVTPALERELAFRESGVVRNLYVEPGMGVSAGQLIAELELGTLQEQLREAQIVAEQDALAISRTSESATIEVRRAEIALEEAQAALAELKTPPTQAEVVEARAQLQRTEAALARARNDASSDKTKAERALKDAVLELESLQAVYGDLKARNDRRATEELRRRLVELEPLLRLAASTVALAQIDYDTALGNEVAAVNAAQADVDLARATLQKLLAGPEPFAVAEAERAVRLAAVQLDAARQETRPEPELAKRLAASQLAVKEIESSIETRRIYAPFDGTVTAVDALASFPVQAEIPVVRLMDNSGLQVSVSGLSAELAARLTPGMPVRLSFVRFPDRELSGTVRPPVMGGGASGVPVVGIAYDTPNLALSINDLASVTVDFGERKDVLWLPPEAVRRDSADYVLLLVGGAEQRADISLGAITDERIEIRVGLREGDSAILP